MEVAEPRLRCSGLAVDWKHSKQAWHQKVSSLSPCIAWKYPRLQPSFSSWCTFQAWTWTSKDRVSFLASWTDRAWLWADPPRTTRSWWIPFVLLDPRQSSSDYWRASSLDPGNQDAQCLAHWKSTPSAGPCSVDRHQGSTSWTQHPWGTAGTGSWRRAHRIVGLRW